MKQPYRTLLQKLNVETYAKDQAVEFKFVPSVETEQQKPTVISVPLPVVFRLYHLGRAYDLQQLIHLHPTGSSAFHYLPQTHLLKELEQLTRLVNDPVVLHYSNELISRLRSASSDKAANLIVKVV